MLTRRSCSAHGGSYSIYYALALASKELKADHRYVSLREIGFLTLDVAKNPVRVRRPDFTNTEPVASIGPFPQWGDKKKIVAMDPWGHIAPWLFKDMVQGEDSMSGLLTSRRRYSDVAQLIFGQASP